MVFDIALASKFTNIGALEDMRYSALAWWHPSARKFIKAMKKGAIF
jgi:hypothetical protein